MRGGCVARSVFSVPRANTRPVLDLRNAVLALRVDLEKRGERQGSARGPVPRGDFPDHMMPRVQPQLTAVPVMRVTGEAEEGRRASALAPVRLVDTVAQVRARINAQGRVQQEDSETRGRRLASALARVLLVGMAVQARARTNALGLVPQGGTQRLRDQHQQLDRRQLTVLRAPPEHTWT